MCLYVVLSCAVGSAKQDDDGELWNFMCYAYCTLRDYRLNASFKLRF